MRRAVLLLVLLLAPPVHAQGVAFEGDATASALDAPGTGVSGPMRFVGSLHLLPDSVLRVDAASADVEVLYKPYRRTPVVGVDTYLGDDATRSRGPVHHENVSAWSVRVGNTAFLQAEGLDGPGGAPTAEATLPASQVVSRGDLRFQEATHAGSEWAPYRSGPWPGLEVTGDGAVVVRGDLVVSFYDLDLRLREAEGEVTYESGYVPSDGDRDDVDAQDEGEQRRVVATFHDAVVTLDPGGAEVLTHLAEARIVGRGRAVLRDAEGVLLVGSREVPVAGDVGFDADWTGTLRPEGPRVAARWEGSVHSILVDGATLDLASVAVQRPPGADTPWSWLAPLLVGLLVAPPLALRTVRMRRLDTDALVSVAGWELEGGRPRRASAWSRRALRRDAGDADAAAIRTVALYRRGRHAEAVAWLEAWIGAHGDPGGELLVLLGLGRLETEGADVAARTVHPVLVADPSLRRLLEATDA